DPDCGYRKTNQTANRHVRRGTGSDIIDFRLPISNFQFKNESGNLERAAMKFNLKLKIGNRQ
ncbi:MAG: hypothetical protein ACYSUT_13060, partial [Planctomycetota bacterium]